ncbi:MAG: anthranilate synthase component I [Candidatus Dadabacteria bacterium]|nr:anthranilate synthase component I [Candidatus Dadabacteria bacterium]
MISPSFTEFKKKLKHGNLIPVWDEIPQVDDTPVSVFAKIDRSEHSFLFESADGTDKWARHSFLGSGSNCIFRARGRSVEIIENGSARTETGDPFELLRKLLGRYKFVADPGVAPFSGGAVGHMNYDAVRLVEDLPASKPDLLGVWDLHFAVTFSVLIFDNTNSSVKTVVCAHCPDPGRAKEVYDSATEEIERLKSAVAAPPPRSSAPARGDGAGAPSSNFERADFESAVAAVKEYIRAGDIIQAVISQRWHTPLDVKPLALYRALRELNPSPYMFLLKTGGQTLVGASPEVMVRKTGAVVESRPIAGTRPRGADAAADDALARQLLADEKERAEHIMLVDLARNDLGRVAKPGTVKVDSFMKVERYSHVMHMTSNVRGEIAPGRDMIDLVKAVFPAGTLSGAPKVRAMEIIDEIEPSTRGPYGGAVGYMSFSGDMDTCIAIRTFLIKDGSIYFQAGAGIVADSDPAKEYEETVNKARALIKALEKARGARER